MKLKHEIILFAGGCLFGTMLASAFAVGCASVRPTLAVEVQP